MILPPGEAHTGGPSDGTHFEYRVMYPAADLLADGAARPPRFPEPVVMDPSLAAGLRQVHAALSRAASGTGPLPSAPLPGRPLAGGPLPSASAGTEPLETESQLCWLFGELVRRHAAPPGPGDLLPGTGAVARRVMNRLADQLTSPPALADLAAETGLSRYQLLRAFRAEVGMPPYAWLAQHRVARARVLLERGHRPAAAATLTGFADQAHLTRWFRRVVGVTPGAYRNGVQDSSRAHR